MLCSRYAKHRDDLPTVRASRLRSLNIITAETTRFLVRLGDVEQNVSVHLRRFPGGGSWSLFSCPACGDGVRTLRLHLDAIVCPCCCERRGIWPRAYIMSLKQRAERRISKLNTMLESKDSRCGSSHIVGQLERRAGWRRRLRKG